MSNKLITPLVELYSRLKSLGHAIPMNNKGNRAIRGAYIHAAIMCYEYANSCKQQIIDAYNQGYRDGESDAIGGQSPDDNDIGNFYDAEKYYNEKYNTNETI